VAGGMSWAELQRRYVRVFRDVYVPAGTHVDAALRAQCAWLWSRRRGVIAGFGAAALHGGKWVEPSRSIDLYHDNRHRPPGLRARSEPLTEGDVDVLKGIPATTSVRTALC